MDETGATAATPAPFEHRAFIAQQEEYDGLSSAGIPTYPVPELCLTPDVANDSLSLANHLASSGWTVRTAVDAFRQPGANVHLGVAATEAKHGIPQSPVSNWRNRDARRVARPSAEPERLATPVEPVASATRNGARVARSYTPSEKARALEYAAEHGVTKASDHFGISRFSLYEWRRQLKKAVAGEGPSPTSGPAPTPLQAVDLLLPVPGQGIAGSARARSA